MSPGRRMDRPQNHGSSPMKPKPYIPRPWQLPHLLATPAGGKVLIVERCEVQPYVPKNDGRCVPAKYANWCLFFRPLNEPHEVFVKHRPPLGFVGSLIRIEGVGDFRTTAIDLRRVDSMTAREANLWGVKAELDRDGTDADRLIAVVTEQEAAKETWIADNHGATWGDWAWFYTAERAERA